MYRISESLIEVITVEMIIGQPIITKVKDVHWEGQWPVSTESFLPSYQETQRRSKSLHKWKSCWKEEHISGSASTVASTKSTAGCRATHVASLVLKNTLVLFINMTTAVRSDNTAYFLILMITLLTHFLQPPKQGQHEMRSVFKTLVAFMLRYRVHGT